MSWSSKRKTIYSGSFLAIVVLILSVAFYLFIYKLPTCADGKQNQDEQGVDCGGLCPIVCNFEAINPIVLWSRSFKVTDGIYNLLALVENPNFEFEALGVPYSFKVKDDENILIYERRGTVDILSRSVTPIFEKTVFASERTPSKTFFEFIGEPVWGKTIKGQSDLSVKNKIVSNFDTKPRLDVTIENKTENTVKNIEVTAIVYDSEGNAINISQTIIGSMKKNSSENIVFTWIEPFPENPSRIEVIPLVKYN